MSFRRMGQTLMGLAVLGVVLTPQAALAQAAAPAPGAASPSAAAPAAEPGNLEVVASYTGKGDVTADREISVFLFSDPNINESSTPIATDVIVKNGGSAKFQGLPGSAVYIVLVYDDNGTYERTGPPAPGTPIHIHMGKDGAPEGVKTGKDAKVTLTFDDSRRM